MNTSKRAVSLSLELNCIRDAVEGACTLATTVRDERLDDIANAAAVAAQIAGDEENGPIFDVAPAKAKGPRR